MLPVVAAAEVEAEAVVVNALDIVEGRCGEHYSRWTAYYIPQRPIQLATSNSAQSTLSTLEMGFLSNQNKYKYNPAFFSFPGLL
jgi:hypothetical protein